MSETTEAPAPEATETPNTAPTETAQTTEAPAAPAAPETEPAPPTAPPKEDWREQRIRALTAKHAAEAERVRSLEERLEALTRAQQTQGTETAPKATQAAPQGDIEALVAAEASRREFDKACNDTYSAGKGKFADFDDAVKGFNLIGGAPKQFLEAVTALEHPADVFYALGKDPGEAIRIIGLSPAKQTYELSKIEAKLMAPPAPKAVSRAPSPISPIAPGNEVDENAEPDPAENPKAYMAWVSKRVARR